MSEKYLISRRKLWILLTECMIDRSQYDRNHTNLNDKTFNQTYPNWFENALKENNIKKVEANKK